jgi:preprotein translocase subunit SecB
MADNIQGGASGANGQAPDQQVQVRVVAQYIKDFSFENPSIERLLQGPGDDPNLKVEVNVNARPMADKLFESAIHFTAKAESKVGVIYEVECVYAGLFQIENMPQQSLEPFLLINGPTLIFPFLRRLLADVTREGGFPPLLLDPIDFAQLYLQRQQQMGSAGNDNPKLS